MIDQNPDLIPNDSSLNDLPLSPQRLPDELIRIIVEIAAEQDQAAAYALALTNRKISHWTASARFRTVHISSIKQLVSFWKTINCYPEPVCEDFWYLHNFLQRLDVNQIGEEEKSRLGERREEARERMIALQDNKAYKKLDGVSFPNDFQPHIHVKNLFIDIQSNTDSVQRLEVPKFVTSCEFYKPYSDLNKKGPLDLLNRWENEENISLDSVSLGPLELSLYKQNCILSKVSIRQLTIISADDDFWSNWSNWTPRNLERLHMIGYDEESPLSGITPPWQTFKDLRMSYAEDKESKLTHIRFDTPRFSLKPAEITARRLGPLLQELTLATAYTNANDKSSNTTKASSYQYNGSRFAAPTPGAGSYSKLEPQNRFVSIHKLAQQGNPIAQHMCEIGVGRLMLFQFAWEPMIDTKERYFSRIPWYKRALNKSTGEESHEKISEEAGLNSENSKDQNPSTSLSETGGWPRERKGAWAERAEKSTAPNAFAIELRDAIDEHWGWYEEGIEPAGKYCARMEREMNEGIQKSLYERNSTLKSDHIPIFFDEDTVQEEDCKEIREVAASIKKNVPNWQEIQPQLITSDLKALCYGVRAPKSLFHLGGKAAFTYHDRLHMFLDRAHGGKGPWP